MAAHDTALGFIGLGKMGVPMVRRLMGAGFEVHVANRSQEVVHQMEGEGAIPGDVGEVVERAEIIMLALPDEPSVDEVIGQIVAGARSGQLVIEHSTISPGLARESAAQLAEKRVSYIDAPVSGGPAGAEAGKLTVMVGGDEEVLERARPVLSAYGDPIRHCGQLGAGQGIKLVNQLLVAIHTSASAEAAAFAARMEIDLNTVAEVIGTSFGSSAMLARNLPRFVGDDYAPATPVSLIAKDLSLIHRQAEDLEVPLRMGSTARDIFGDASARSLGGSDMAALYQLWSDQS